MSSEPAFTVSEIELLLTNKLKGPPSAPPTIVVCSVHNPSETTPRAFYDGINDQPIRLEPRETKEGLRIAEYEVDRMEASSIPNDLKVTRSKPKESRTDGNKKAGATV